MKKQTSFADEATRIMKKYEDKRSKYDMNMLNSEMEDLRDKQEETRASMGISNDNGNQFEGGGDTVNPEDLDMVLQQEQEFTNWENQYNANRESYKPSISDYLSRGYSKTEKVVNSVGNNIKENPSKWANTARAITAVGGNIAAMKYADRIDTSVIDPVREKLIYNVDNYNSEPGATAIQQNVASSRYAMFNRGADFNSIVSANRILNNDANRQIGLNDMEGQKINISNQARRSELATNVQNNNAKALTQARIDSAMRKENINKEKRAYLTAIANNLSGVFKDISDSELAKKMGKLYKEKGIYDSLG